MEGKCSCCFCCLVVSCTAVHGSWKKTIMQNPLPLAQYIFTAFCACSIGQQPAVVSLLRSQSALLLAEPRPPAFLHCKLNSLFIQHHNKRCHEISIYFFIIKTLSLAARWHERGPNGEWTTLYVPSTDSLQTCWEGDLNVNCQGNISAFSVSSCFMYGLNMSYQNNWVLFYLTISPWSKLRLSKLFGFSPIASRTTRPMNLTRQQRGMPAQRCTMWFGQTAEQGWPHL